MKLIIAIVQDDDEVVLNQAFQENRIRATKLSTTGGFLKSGNTTFIVGIDDDKVDQVLSIIKDCSKRRQQYVPLPTNYDVDFDMSQSFPVQVDVGGATVFVLPVDGFYQY
ncbi:cyclic-di-AMP receptor [Ignavigranum ruoffiae]|mgnify:CR=1 FL=1|uniref:Uncharacterized protein YaaQ n=1 Tax=Ignavigranum ruoffiae TaxID=89093 RepID=A0A1H9BJZ3_9LACT|nr:cyclic-di-AMP receptor [Ignavigranum ruoffiae]UPQ86497.1 cyclic-di-AMP receptor [Ignavigranum ruoffiae]SEP89314.1 Uncharacterized protein YaaQ [Ignavigranum ruoffiae]